MLLSFLLAAQQRENVLGRLIGLSQHRGSGLGQNVGSRQRCRLGSEVGIFNSRTRFFRPLNDVHQVRDSVLETIDVSASLRTTGVQTVQRSIMLVTSVAALAIEVMLLTPAAAPNRAEA